jgi:hypothetical protein
MACCTTKLVRFYYNNMILYSMFVQSKSVAYQVPVLAPRTGTLRQASHSSRMGLSWCDLLVTLDDLPVHCNNRCILSHTKKQLLTSSYYGCMLLLFNVVIIYNTIFTILQTRKNFGSDGCRRILEYFQTIGGKPCEYGTE